MSRPLLVPLAAILLFCVFTPSAVSACEKRQYISPTKYMDEMDLWLRATVMDHDDAAYNAILYAEEYYKGDGPRLLVVKRHEPALMTVKGLHGYSIHCGVSGYGQWYNRGTQGYFGLKSNGDGTYTDWRLGSANRYARDGWIRYIEDFSSHEIAEQDFVARLLELGGRDAPVPPRTEDGQHYPLRLYPLMRYLSITTESGRRYQVNPDRSVTPVAKDAPIAVSPDGAHWALRLDDDHIALGRPYKKQGDDSVTDMYRAPGRELRFSNDSNMVAVWNESALNVYMLTNWRDGGYGTHMKTLHIAQIDLDGSDKHKPRAMWSADSSTLAWQDASGIWRWDLFEEAQPSQIVGSEGCGLLDISNQGRYLRCGTARAWMLHDSLTGAKYRNALAAPGEKTLVFINSDDAPDSARNDETKCLPPLKDTCALYIDSAVHPVETHLNPSSRGSFRLLFCEYDGLCALRQYFWHPAVSRTYWHGETIPNMKMAPWRAVAYDPLYDRSALLYGDYHIDIDWPYDESIQFARPGRPLLDLEGEVDSPISTIEWGRPVFYDTFMLTATEYLPRTVTIAGLGSPSHAEASAD